ANSVVDVKTAQGNFSFKLGDIPYGKLVGDLDGAVEVERTASAVEVTNAKSKSDDDYPSAAAGPDGTVNAAYTSFTPGLDGDSRARRLAEAPADYSFLAKAPGGDQLWLRTVTGPKHIDPIPVTPTGSDIYKSSVTVDGSGTVWVFWAENKNYKPYPQNP